LEQTGSVVLIVEDDPEISNLLRELLELEGYSVESAADGAAGLARVEAGGIDLLLLDLMLPKLDGLELCRRARAQTGDVYLPIIMLTGLTDEAQRHAGFVCGADDYVTKPFNVDELLDRVRVWLGTRQRLKSAHERLLLQQERLRELEQRKLREELAQNEAVLVMMQTPLSVLLKLLVVWESSQPSAESAARVRSDLQGATSELAAGISTLSRILRGESVDSSTPTLTT
jgi:DNA-binding response OmpR family regulator